MVARLRTVTAFQRPPRGGLRRLGRECAQKPGTLTSRVSKGATTRLQPCREPARSSQPPGRAACTWGAAVWPLRRGVSMRRTAYDGPLSSATVPDGGGHPRTRHGAASLDKRQGRLYAAPGRPLRPDSSGAARGGLAFRASPRPPEGSLGGEDTTTIRAPPGQTTALKARRDVYVLRLQRWRRGWSRSLPAVDAKWPAGARDEHRLPMISAVS